VTALEALHELMAAAPSEQCERCDAMHFLLVTGDDSRGPRTVCPPCWQEIDMAPAAPQTAATRVACPVRPAEPAPEHIQMALDHTERTQRSPDAKETRV
jgi:hypothetical protein